MSEDLKFKHPFTCIISGHSGSGKSSFCVPLLQHLDALCSERDFESGVIWFIARRPRFPRRHNCRRVMYILTRASQQILKISRGRPCLVILDDMLNIYSKQVCDLFTKGSHHRNMSVILITQTLFHHGRYCRDISLNAKYLVLLKNVREIMLVSTRPTWTRINEPTGT